MGEYNNTTRQQLLDSYRKKWKLKMLLPNKNTREFIKEIEKFNIYRPEMPKIEEAVEAITSGSYQSPSEYMRKNCRQLVYLYVPKNDRDAYYQIIDKYNRFQYSSGMNRRTVRSREYGPNVKNIFRLLYDYFLFGFYECDLSSFLKNELPEEKLDYKTNMLYGHRIERLDDMIAARLDSGDGTLKKTVKDIILSENNTAVITNDIIRGIIKSSDSELHKLLGDFLLAARLQEGVRQAICENTDCGTAEAFLTLFHVICENNLIRFSSVKRAIATWTGVCDENNMDRITAKVVGIMQQCLENKDRTYELTQSNDTVEIMIALWTLGFYEVKDAIAVMEQYLRSGSRNQQLTMSYYNIGIGYKKFCEITSKKVISENPEDMELAAAFMPSYLDAVDTYIYRIFDRNDSNTKTEDKVYLRVPVTYLFDSEEEARKHFRILKGLYESMTAKKKEFNPCIFPWYGVSLTKTQLIKRICMIAYSVQDAAMIDYAVLQLPGIDVSEYYSCRDKYTEILLHDPKTPTQWEMLVRSVADKESYTRKIAYELVKITKLEKEHYIILEEMLRYKAADIRQNVITLLCGQEDDDLSQSVERLLKDGREEVRTGGLDLVIQLKKDPSRNSLADRCINIVKTMENPTAKEQILVDELCGKGESETVLNEKGYGLYDPEAGFAIPEIKADRKLFEEFYNLSGNRLKEIIDKLDVFIDMHKDLSYMAANGEENLLGNGLHAVSYDSEVPYADRMPFKELWIEFYQKEIRDFKTLSNLYAAAHTGLSGLKNQPLYNRYEKEIFGSAVTYFDYSGYRYGGKMGYGLNSTIFTVLEILADIYADPDKTKEITQQILLHIIKEFPEEALWYEENVDKRYYLYEERRVSFLSSWRMMHIVDCWDSWSGEKEFNRRFYLFYQTDRRFRFNDKKNKDVYSASQSDTRLNIFDYIKAYNNSLIPADTIYQAIFEDIGLGAAFSDFGILLKEPLYPYEENRIKRYGLTKEIDKENKLYQSAMDFYGKITDKVLAVELKRGDIPTAFSSCIHKIMKIYGIKRLAEILTALGGDKLDRSSYYSWSSNTGKASCLSHLLQVCYPEKDDTAERLRGTLKGTSVGRQRLIETAMYAPQWIDLIEEYFGYKGLKSGCYYFMAHMNERFDDRKMAMIARYTPLSEEELNNGAFDVTWFREAYGLLGEKTFSELYQAAKYISDGSKHARARKYADAALGKVTVSALESDIDDKRNKDLLMSYGLIPVEGEQDMLHRYEYLQKFLKESKQFGAQRRASEAAAVDMALKNLATAAGYSDVTRLILSMETELIKSFASYLEWEEVEGVSLKIAIDEYGKANILCRKKDKLLASVPAALKKNEYVIKLREVHKKLKEQYSRTVKMFEQAMEDREIFLLGELSKLCENPMVSPIIRNLVYITQKEKTEPLIGFPDSGALIRYDGTRQQAGGTAAVRVAHPFDLYHAGCWTEYQEFFFRENAEGSMRKQPFKQVFRELYVKIEEELDRKNSLMFAGNQIQPKKTAACLKGRRWIADYQEGLQKVYYKENIVARIYALADWFSPSDVEAPTLEWVEFSDRKSFRALTVREIPDIIFSEVMRDVDMAVSVAHAGGVDPETSHSTIEMRSVIIAFNLPLFGIKNVTLKGSHALIKGTRAEYNIHLGSGVIHKTGGTQINVLPVHSQSRGKLFLPFIDDDPKTAEIMSKIVLFARDGKIADPYILSQL